MNDLRVGVVLSHPFHVGLGTDFRLFNQIYPLANRGIQLRIISQFGPGLATHPRAVQYFCLNSYPKVFELGYGVTRYIFNRPILARQFLRSSAYLNWSVNSFAEKLERLITREPVDVLLAIHPLAAAACSRIDAKVRPPIVADIHGVWSDELVESGCLQRESRQANIAARFEKDCLDQVDKIVVVSDELGNRLNARYSIPSGKIVVIDPCVFPRIEKARKVTRPTKIVCPATSTYREGLDLLLKAMSLVQGDFPETTLFLTKKGDTFSKTKRLSKELGVRAEYFYFPDMERFYRFLSQCHIGVLTSSESPGRRVSYPAKLYDYLSVGIPIVANDIGGWSQVIRDSRAGILTDSTPESLASGICSLIREPEKAYEFGKNGLSYLHSRLNPQARLEAFSRVLRNA